MSVSNHAKQSGINLTGNTCAFDAAITCHIVYYIIYYYYYYHQTKVYYFLLENQKIELNKHIVLGMND